MKKIFLLIALTLAHAQECRTNLYEPKPIHILSGVFSFVILSKVYNDLSAQYRQYCKDCQLHHAVNMMDLKEIKKALDNGANVNAIDVIETSFEKVVLWEYEPAIQLLLAHGATVDRFSFDYLKRVGLYKDIKSLIPQETIERLEAKYK